jgi:hypothetical protein
VYAFRFTTVILARVVRALGMLVRLADRGGQKIQKEFSERLPFAMVGRDNLRWTGEMEARGPAVSSAGPPTRSGGPSPWPKSNPKSSSQS